MAKKRGHGEGSITQRQDGRWSAIITVGYDQNGKRRRKTVYGKTKREVTEELTRLQNQKLDGQLLVRERTTIAELIDRWLTHWAPKLADSTRLRYRQASNLYIIPELGGMTVEKLQPLHVRALLDKMASNGAGPRTLEYTFATLRRAMTLACRLDLATSNPCSRVEPPKAKSKPICAPDGEQVAALLEAVSGHRFEALFVLAVTTGLRQGELFALDWEDVDLERGKLVVRRSLEEVQGRLKIKEPKSAAGRRAVRLPALAVEALEAHRKRTARIGGTIFTDADGGWLRKSNFQRRVWKPVFKAAGLDGVRFHDLRHAHASMLLRERIHPKIVQERLGHSSIKLTMDTYSHLLPDAQDEAATATDRAFRRPPANGRQLVVKSDSEAAGDSEGVSEVAAG